VVDEANLKVSNTPTNGYFLSAQSGNTGGLTWAAAASGGGADLYAANESSPSAQPSATGTNAVAVGDSAVAAGYQAIALGNANASGEQSFAVGIRNNTTSYGSVGSYSFAQGRQAKAQGSYSVSLGRNSLATATSATAIGYQAKAQGNYSIGMGFDCKPMKSYSVALGSCSNANAIGKFAFGSGSSNTYGYAQSGMIVVAGRTANATTGVLVSDNATQSMGTADDDNQLYLEPFGAMAFDGLIVARGQGSASDTNSAAWKVEGLIRRENAASTTTLVNSAITVISNVPNWGLSLSADTSNGCLSVNVTGASAANVKWVCTLRSSETIYNSY
jgi:hypothetical protein